VGVVRFFFVRRFGSDYFIFRVWAGFFYLISLAAVFLQKQVAASAGKLSVSFARILVF